MKQNALQIANLESRDPGLRLQILITRIYRMNCNGTSCRKNWLTLDAKFIIRALSDGEIWTPECHC